MIMFSLDIVPRLMQNFGKQFTNSMPPEAQKMFSELVDCFVFSEKNEGLL